MAVNLTNADSALKSFYLDAVSEQLNNKVNPFFAKIKQSTADVWGKDVKKLAIYGMNGGIGAGTEDGNLPDASSNNYAQMVSTLKNLYGTIEISDKAVRASENNSGAFVSLLNAEMDGLINSSTFNFGRMLFGDGTGVIATVSGVENGVITLDGVKNVLEGMLVDFRDAESGEIISGGRKIAFVDRTAKTVTVTGTALNETTVPVGSLVSVQGSYNNEITGLKAIFDTEKDIYGLSRKSNSWLNPTKVQVDGEITEIDIQTALDEIEEKSGSAVDIIVCSWGVRRALQKLFSASNRNVNVLELEGGFKAMSYNGIPVVADRFCPDGTMYLLNSADFTLHQLCDWQWLAGEDGKVLKQIAGKPVYTATLVKYAELICAKPYGQGVITGITEA